MSEIIADEYQTLLSGIKTRIRDAQYEALRVVNKELIECCQNSANIDCKFLAPIVREFDYYFS